MRCQGDTQHRHHQRQHERYYKEEWRRNVVKPLEMLQSGGRGKRGKGTAGGKGGGNSREGRKGREEPGGKSRVGREEWGGKSEEARASKKGRVGREKWEGKSGGGKSREGRVGEGSSSLARRQLARVVTAPAPADESCATADHRLAHPLTTSCSDPVYRSHTLHRTASGMSSGTAPGMSSGMSSDTSSGMSSHTSSGTASVAMAARNFRWVSK